MFAACFRCAFRFNTYVALAAASRLAGERGLALISVPIGVLVPVVNLAAQMNGHGAPVARPISSGTLLAALTLPLWISLVGRPGPAGRVPPSGL